MNIFIKLILDLFAIASIFVLALSLPEKKRRKRIFYTRVSLCIYFVGIIGFYSAKCIVNDVNTAYYLSNISIIFQLFSFIYLCFLKLKFQKTKPSELGIGSRNGR